MKKMFITAILLVLTLSFLFSCENDRQNSDKTSELSDSSSSPFEEAPEIKDGFETPILPNN